jgi:hypothetical protein
MKNIRLVPRLALVALGVASACSGPDAPSPAASPSSPAVSFDPDRPLPSPIPEVVARVNGRPIRIGQILPIARGELVKVKIEDREAQRPRALRQALRRYIDRELLLQEAIARGVEADTRALDWAYDQARREHPDEEAWVEHLAEEGFDPESFRAELRIQHMVSLLLAAEGGDFWVTDEDVRRAYDAEPGAWSVEGETPPPFEEVRERIETTLRHQKRAETSDVLLRKLKARARIETFL